MDTLVLVTWTDPALHAAAIKEYKIHAMSSSSNDTMVTVPGGKNAANITGLVPTFSYNISVIVVYKVGSFMSDSVVTQVTLSECEGN